MNLTIQKIALVQCYIHHRTNKEVNIQPPRTKKQMELLEVAYSVAVDYFGFDMRVYGL